MSPAISKAKWNFRAISSLALLVASLAIFTSAFAQSDASPSPDEPQSKAEIKADQSVPVEDSAKNAALTGKGSRIIASFTVFLLAVFVGVEVINKVPPTLHTPLMSGSNAISGITVIGSLLTAGHVGGGFGATLGMIAVVLAMINVAGGYLVTHRMLMMFKKR